MKIFLDMIPQIYYNKYVHGGTYTNMKEVTDNFGGIPNGQAGS